jgi:hypothetical protein
MARFGSGDEVGKWTYTHHGWKISVLSINKGYTQAVSPDGNESLFFDSEQTALDHINQNG